MLPRRHFLRIASALFIGALACTPFASAEPPAKSAKARKILFFSKSSGFEHSVISYKKGQPSLVEKALMEIGPAHNWEFTFSKDGSLFTPAYLAGFDAFFFYTTGNLCEPGTDEQPAMTPEGKQALLDAISGGKGFIGSHSAADTFHTDNESKKGPDRYVNHWENADPYVRMLGAEFIKHGKQQIATMRCVSPKFPGMEHCGESFSLMEEWYSLKDFRDDIQVLLVQETEGMTGPEYQRGSYPATWVRKHGAGRVFYTSMGHRDEVWASASFREMLIGGIAWAVGDVQAEVLPNIKEVTPRAWETPPYVPPKESTSAAAADASKSTGIATPK